MYLGTTLVNVVVLLFLFHHVSAITTSMNEVSGKCKDLCDKRRPTGVFNSFKFKCDTDDCKVSCEECPKEVCDETISGSGANDWHCPKAASCIDVCNKYRGKGSRENYTLNCEDAYSGDKKKLKNCKDDCGKCPSFMCTDGKTLLCPYEPFTGECREFCDEHRGYGDVGKFTFDCNSITDATKKTECQDMCKSDDCPDWVCDGRSRGSPDTYKFHCPSLLAHPDCRRFCDSDRKGDDGPFNLDCGEKYPYDPKDCDNVCSSEKCNEVEGSSVKTVAVCDPSSSSKTEIFKCPGREPPEGEALFKRKSYKGECMEFCEQNRGGGIDPFGLNCNTRYETTDEVAACKTICNDNCPNGGIGQCSNSGYISCDGQRKEIRKREEDKRRKEKAWQDKLQNQKDTHYDFLLGSVVFTILLMACFCSALVHMRRKHFVPPLISQQPVVAVAAQQSQPQMQVSAVSQPSSQMLQPQPPQDGNQP